MKSITLYEKVCLVLSLVFVLSMLGYLQMEHSTTENWAVSHSTGEVAEPMAEDEVEALLEEEGIEPERDLLAQPININQAMVEELCLLPGIGEVRAGAIIAYREEVAFFETTEELMAVSGIGEGIFGDVALYIVVE